MKYNFNGKEINIPDSEISKSMKVLQISQDEAVQMWLEDEGYIENAEVEALTAKAKANKISHEAKSNKTRKPSTRERKVDNTKKRLLSDVRVLIEGLGGRIESVKTETEITFTFENAEYSFKLIKHRPKK